ncbi:hypothetical protein [Micromonospora sp. NPDC093277]|uniref:hypothetical protein n=1 Tax=Micromonospora sp. NPDC093277 TaxID=3364291 RepID=UPI0038308238
MTSPTAPVRPARPAVVTVAFWLQIAIVAVLLVLVGVVVFAAVRYNGQIDEALRRVPDADPVEVSDERSGNVFTAVTLGVPALLLAAWLAATALPLCRGSNPARILVFVAAGAQLLLCLGQCGGGLLMIPFMLAMGGPEFDPTLDPEAGGTDWEQSKFLDALYDQGDPGELLAVGGLGLLLVLALTLAVVVLLLVPESGRWFRPASAAVPPVPYGYWPVYPAAYAPVHPVAAYPPGYPAAAYPGHPASGYPSAVMPPPAGYPLCPDPALHLAYPPTGPWASTQHASPWAAPGTGPADPTPGTGAADPTPGTGPADPTPGTGPADPTPGDGPSVEPARDDAGPGAAGPSTGPADGPSGS